VVIKHNVNLNYCTDGVSSAIFQKVCAKAGVPVQSYHNRSDIRGGSTLGRISLGKISLPTVDIGLPQLAMHSCYETGATADVIYLEKAMTAYYSRTLEARGDNWILN
jgi:aspartyl aminopeptidase